MGSSATGSAVGARVWFIPEGYVPTWSHGPAPQLSSHGTACILKAGERGARVKITLYFADREPAGRYRAVVGARPTRHCNELDAPEPVATDVAFCSVLRADEPLVVQHVRLESRRADNALMTTRAHAADRG